MKKLIDFETLKANCGHKTAFGDCHTSTFSDYVKICNKDTCPIWNSLPDVPEPDQSKDTERLNTKEQPTWLEYEGY